MQKKIYIPAALLIASLLASAFFISRNNTKYPNTADGEYEGGGKMAEWEWKRLRDPATGEIPAYMREKELAFAATLPTDASLAMKTGGDELLWKSRGPWNYGGRTRALAIDVDNENILFAGAVSGGLWRSLNAGQSWAKVSNLAHNPSVTCIAQDLRPDKHSTWYYGTGEGTGTSASGGKAFFLGAGLFKSDDSGNSWNRIYPTSIETPQSFGPASEIIWNLALDPSNIDSAGEVYLAVYGSILRSTNGGNTFATAIGPTLVSTSAYYTNVACTRTGVVYATLSSDGYGKGIWRSADGIVWTQIIPTGFGDRYNRIAIGINPSDENEVYFLGDTPGSGQTTTNFYGREEQVSLWRYRYLSGDGSGAGGSWTDLSASIPNTRAPMGNMNIQGGYDLMVRVQPGNSNNVFIGGTNLFRSTDAFNTPDHITHIGGYGVGTSLPFFNLYPNHHPDQHDILFLPSNPDVAISASDGGLYRSNNILAPVVSWNSLNRGYLSTQFYTLGINHTDVNNKSIASGAQDNGTLFSNQDNEYFNWTMPSSGDGSYVAAATGGNLYYFSRQQGKMMKAFVDANGVTTRFTRIDPLAADTDKYDFINPFVLDPIDERILYMAGGDRIWRNSDVSAFNFDSTWTRKDLNWDTLINTIDASANISAMAISRSNPVHRLYYGTDNKKVFRVDNAHTGQPTRTNITPTGGSVLFPTNGHVSCIAIHPDDANKVLVVFSNYGVYSLFYSETGGTNWKKVAGNLEQFPTGSGNGPSLRWASILPLASGGAAYFVGASTGLYATDKLIPDSTVWIQQGANTIGNAVVNVIETRKQDGWIVVATHGNGIYTSNINNSGQVSGLVFSKAESMELGNYPNPMNENTTLEFKLSRSGQAEIILTDELGRMVRQFPARVFPAGINRIPLERNGLKAGLYYYTIITGEQKETKAMVVR